MSDFTEGSQTASQEGNPFRPYADPLGSNHNDKLYEELKDPVGDLRNYSNNGAFPQDPYRISGSESGGMAGLGEFDVKGLEFNNHVDTAQNAKNLFRLAGYRYLATLATSPFNIAQTLLQVQYLPAAVQQPELIRSLVEDGHEYVDEAGDMFDPDSLAYYDYLRARHSDRGTQYHPAERAHVDHDGYVVNMQEKGVNDFKPRYQLDALPAEKLVLLRKLITHPTEGFLSMFKGCFTQWLYDILHLLLQPSIEVVLNEMLGVYDSAPLYTYIDAAAPSALTVVASNLIVGWMLSPLELVRTRLMVQSASPIHRKYHGTYHALKTIAKEEGGIWSMYFSPYNLVPTVVRHTMDPIFRSMRTFVLDRVFGIDPYDHPTTFAFGSLVWGTIAATVMLPIHTIRTRLHAQPRYTSTTTAGSTRRSTTSGSKSAAKAVSKNEKQAAGPSFKEFRTCVPISPIPYTGMVNCAWRVITEEGEPLKKMKNRWAAHSASGNTEKISNVGHYGLRGLYPGFTLQMAANVMIFGLSFIRTDEIDFS